MSQESESDSEETGYTRSGKRFKVDLSSSFFDDTSATLENRLRAIEKENQRVSLIIHIPHKSHQGLSIIS